MHNVQWSWVYMPGNWLRWGCKSSFDLPHLAIMQTTRKKNLAHQILEVKFSYSLTIYTVWQHDTKLDEGRMNTRRWVDRSGNTSERIWAVSSHEGGRNDVESLANENHPRAAFVLLAHRGLSVEFCSTYLITRNAYWISQQKLATCTTGLWAIKADS